VEVDTATTQDTSLIASLGEYFSYSPFIVLYHRYIAMISFLKTQKHKKILFVSFTSGCLSFVS
jgi:3-hydroxy-3-methylglutaryl CoA synthase